MTRCWDRTKYSLTHRRLWPPSRNAPAAGRRLRGTSRRDPGRAPVPVDSASRARRATRGRTGGAGRSRSRDARPRMETGDSTAATRTRTPTSPSPRAWISTLPLAKPLRATLDFGHPRMQRAFDCSARLPVHRRRAYRQARSAVERRHAKDRCGRADVRSACGWAAIDLRAGTDVADDTAVFSFLM